MDSLLAHLIYKILSLNAFDSQVIDEKRKKAVSTDFYSWKSDGLNAVLVNEMTTQTKNRTNMTKILKIDRALYEIDDKTKTYRYYGRNSEWKNINKEENQRNKKHIDGYTRIFPDGRTKVFRYKE